MATMKLKTGDLVKVITGKDRGKTGKVVQVFPDAQRVVVEGINVMKKHMRARRSGVAGGKGEKGQIIQLSAPIHISNVMLVDPSNNKQTRVRIERRDGARVRIAAKSGTVIS